MNAYAAIKKVFAAERKLGTTCRVNFQCCSGCAVAALTAQGHRAMAFFHRQDTQWYTSRGLLPIRYTADTPADTLALGQRLYAALQALNDPGLRIIWDGSPDNVIMVQEVVR